MANANVHRYSPYEARSESVQYVRLLRPRNLRYVCPLVQCVLDKPREGDAITFIGHHLVLKHARRESQDGARGLSKVVWAVSKVDMTTFEFPDRRDDVQRRVRSTCVTVRSDDAVVDNLHPGEARRPLGHHLLERLLIGKLIVQCHSVAKLLRVYDRQYGRYDGVGGIHLLQERCTAFTVLSRKRTGDDGRVAAQRLKHCE